MPKAFPCEFRDDVIGPRTIEIAERRLDPGDGILERVLGHPRRTGDHQREPDEPVALTAIELLEGTWASIG